MKTGWRAWCASCAAHWPARRAPGTHRPRRGTGQGWALATAGARPPDRPLRQPQGNRRPALARHFSGRVRRPGGEGRHARTRRLRRLAARLWPAGRKPRDHGGGLMSLTAITRACTKGSATGWRPARPSRESGNTGGPGAAGTVFRYPRKRRAAQSPRLV